MARLRLVLPTLVAVALCLPATGQWYRSVFSGKGGSDDIPSPHPLRYFTANPFLRDDGNDFCALCTPADKAKSAQKYSVRTTVQRVGTLAGFRIWDVLYSVRARNSPDEDRINWKSILVQVGPNSYKEIFHLQAFYTTVSLSSSRIMQSGSERILTTVDSDGGNGGGCWEGYWWFDESGPHSLDFSRLKSAIKNRLPENTVFSISCSQLHLESEQVHSWVQKSEAQCHACDYVGDITAKFRLDRFIVRPERIAFAPGDPNHRQSQ